MHKPIKTQHIEKSKKRTVRVPRDVDEWLESEAGGYRGVATVINMTLRRAFEEKAPKPKRKARK